MQQNLQSGVLLKEREVAARLGLALSTIRGLRMTGDGPPFIKIGGSVRYDPDDLQEYLQRQKRKSTSEAA